MEQLYFLENQKKAVNDISELRKRYFGLVDDDFIELMRNNKILANHLHLPLQSGSDKILSKMERRYDKAYFLNTIPILQQKSFTILYFCL